MTRKLILFATILTVVLVTLPATAGHGPGRHYGRGQGWGGGGGARSCTLDVDFQGLPREDLDAAETAGILRLREEEKMARDVYRTLGETWGLPAFSNIAGAEQRHMDLMKTLVDRYELTDPVDDDEVGVFTDPSFKALYAELVAAGQVSLADALEVGATIEDMDLADLGRLAAATDSRDLGLAYENLERASRNHLRAWFAHLETRGLTYEARYLHFEELAEIVAMPHERGMRGMGMGRGRSWR